MQLDSTVRSLAHFDQYLGIWACEESRFMAAWNRLQNYDLTQHVRANLDARADFSQASYENRDGVAIVSIEGALTKYGSSLSDAGSTIRIRQAVRNAANDPSVSAIVLRIDSPGGTCAGTGDLADDVAAAAAKKEVVAYCEDLTASAAYWIASQASRVVCNPSALVGSIGTYMAVADYSKYVANMGVKVHVVRAGEMKGAGAMGTEVTDAQLADFQRFVNELNSVFLAAVGKGRGLTSEQVAALADGRVHIAGSALSLGLVDAIQSFDDVLEGLSNVRTATMSRTGPAPKGNAAPRSEMPADGEEEDEDEEDVEAQEAAAQASRSRKARSPRAASIAELKAALPESTADFREKCLESGLTIDAAKSAFLVEQNAALKAENDRLKAAAEAPGVPTLTNGSAKAEATGDPVSAWNDAIAEKVKTGVSKSTAVAAVSRENPELHKAYVAAVNVKKR